MAPGAADEAAKPAAPAEGGKGPSAWRRAAVLSALASTSFRTKLTAVISEAQAQAMSEKEAMGIFEDVMFGVVRLQAHVRGWVTRLKRKRAHSIRVTARTSFYYSSTGPPNPKAKLERQANVATSGWRAPLSRRYRQLGVPDLAVGRKPPERAPAPPSGHALSAAALGSRFSGAHTFVGPGETCRGAVPKFGLAYFATRVTDPKGHLIVSVEPVSGDPDLFISRTETYPTQLACDWSSDAMGAGTLPCLAWPCPTLTTPYHTLPGLT